MVDSAGHSLEDARPASERHGKGQYFTPLPLVELVLSLAGPPPAATAHGARSGQGQLALPLAGCPDDAPVVLDPACGTGRFLLVARRRWGLFPEQLRGVETDVDAIAAARQQLPGAELIEHDFRTLEGSGDVDLLVGNPPYVRSRGEKRDLYVDFLERSLLHLKPGGRLALVLSNAWLDVGYGQVVRHLLLDHFAVEWLVESWAERWFPGARVNTMVLVARREPEAEVRAESAVRLGVVEHPLPARPTVRRSVAQRELPRDLPWGPVLRAPDVFREVSREAPLVSLGALAEVRRGYTTNDNGFFYPPADSGVDGACLRPLLKSPRRVPGVRGRADELPDQVLVCHLDRAALRRLDLDGTLAWIDAHRADQPSSSWQLREQEPARLFLVKGYSDRFRQPLLDQPVFADQQLYCVRPLHEDLGVEELAALLNSSWAHLSVELAGRVNFGDGVLWLGLSDARQQILLPDPRQAPPEQRRELLDAFAALPEGRVPTAGSIDLDPAWGPAWLRLDRAVGALLELTPAQIEAVRRGWQEACARRARVSRPPAG